ncbi:MAG: DUF501 domain-containing protein [Acidimicrobiales bacterium]
MLGRRPAGGFTVVVRDGSGDPVVIRNSPVLDDGTPMPTLYWLVGSVPRLAIDRLESAGGVRAAEAEVAVEDLEAAHAAYAVERDSVLPATWDGRRPSGGVGGTRRGVKCLHAHYAYHLAGGDDPVGRWVERQLEGSPASGRRRRPGVGAGAVAAVDCGTNSTRLLVAGRDGEAIERLMHITRLGEGVDRTRTLAAGAIERTAAVLRRYREVMDSHGVTDLRVTATSAARDAANRETFFDSVERAVGVRPELLDGAEEGRLSYIGATASLDPVGSPWLIADIGGGSTELVLGPVPLAVRSLDIGCVRVTERFLRSDPPTTGEVERARNFVSGLLATATAAVPALAGGRTMVGLAGTVAALAAIDQRLPCYDRDRVHHYVLTRDRVDEMLSALAGETSAARRRRPGVEEARADVIVGGTIVVAELMRHFGFTYCITSESDILDGLVSTILHG